jgi:hypothetical protein
MKPDPSRLRVNPTESQTASQSSAQSRTESFGSVEELLRRDASQIEPPAGVEERLKISLTEASPKASWWRRWLGR